MNSIAMSSNRPYLLRALYEWISDNGLTPYILVDATINGVIAPSNVVQDGRVVLNIAMRAVSQLELGQDAVRFLARFSGVSQSVEIPLAAILAIYAQENGQGMMFPPEESPSPPSPSTPEPAAPRKGAHLRVVK